MTLAQLASKFGVHANQVSAWKAQLLEELPTLFESKRGRAKKDDDGGEAKLYEQIGRLKMELDWLKKNRKSSIDRLREQVDAAHPKISIRRQCELLGLNRSTFYYEPCGESEETLELMRRIDALYTQHPFYGCRTIAKHLGVDKDRVNRLMRTMGIEAIYPKPKTTKRNHEHRVYPYFLGV